MIDSEYFLDYLENLKLEARELWRQQDACRKKNAKERKVEPNQDNEKKEAQDTKPLVTLDKFVAKEGSANETDDVKSNGNRKEPIEEAITAKVEGKDAATTIEEKHEKVKETIKGTNNENIQPESIKVEKGKPELTVDESLMKDYPKEPVSDLVHVVRQRRVMAAKQAQLKDEEEKKDKERRRLLDEIQQQSKRTQAWKDGVDKCKKSLRLEPLGFDRHFKLYWVFSGGMPGIYVEDGVLYHNAGEKRTIDSWECYDTVEDVEKLMKALARQGERESALRGVLSNHYATILSGIKKKNPDKFSLAFYDVFEESIKVLKEDMIESGNRIVRGVLGFIPNHENWEKQVNQAKSLEEIVPLVLELQQGILPKFLEGTLSQTKKGEKMIQKWQENVKEVKTLSALHTLFGILENSVKWDKSAEHVKCKICRRKAGDEYLVLCDECNRGYHPYCLRPALLDIPTDKWKCPACAPQEPGFRAPRSTRRETAIIIDDMPEEEVSEEEEGEDSEEEEEAEIESDHESLCHVCEEDGELICCDQCPKVYHLDCHEPAIRRLPRGMWICFICRNPKALTRAQKKTETTGKSSKSRSKSSRSNSKNPTTRRKRSGKNVRSSDLTEDDEEDAESQEADDADEGGEQSEEEEEATTKKTAKGSRQKHLKSRPRKRAMSTEESEEEDYAQETKSKKRKPGRSAKKNRPRKTKRSLEDEVDEKKSQKTRRTKRKRSEPLNESSEMQSASQSDEENTSRKRKSTEKGSDNNASHGRTARNQRNRIRKQNLEIVACEDILQGMWKSVDSHPFRNPVNPKKVPDYEKYIASPIDLATIRNKLNMLEYEDAFQFVDDVKLLFRNSKTYNEDDSIVGRSAVELETLFGELIKIHLPGLQGSFDDES